MMKWQPGRQGTGYRKLLIAQWRRGDVHLIDYPPSAGIPTHTDPVPGYRHVRINIVILTGGAKLETTRTYIRLGERLVVFASDEPHSVTAGRSRRLVLSFGFGIRR